MRLFFSALQVKLVSVDSKLSSIILQDGLVLQAFKRFLVVGGACRAGHMTVCKAVW